jgi:uncharacterized protein (DUF1330 family)
MKRKDKIKRSGYWYIHLPIHPFSGKQGYVAEHRLVMEKHLGRYLTKQECVHHLNNDINDNRIENLVLCASHGEHTKRFHPEACIKGAEATKGKEPWNKGKTGIYSEETRRTMGADKIGKPAWNKGKPHTAEHVANLKLAWLKRKKVS